MCQAIVALRWCRDVVGGMGGGLGPEARLGKPRPGWGVPGPRGPRLDGLRRGSAASRPWGWSVLARRQSPAREEVVGVGGRWGPDRWTALLGTSLAGTRDIAGPRAPRGLAR